MNNAKREEIFSRLRAGNAHPETELQYDNTFQLLIAVLLSAQATDISVNKATRMLFPIAPNPHAMLALGELKLLEYIQSIGLYKTKARNVLATCQILINNYGGDVPDNREALESLPGVGRKTANVVLNIAFGHPTIAVDTHIFRVGNRTGLAKGKTPLDVEKKLLKHTPAAFKYHAHHWLILLGRYVCKARKPACAQCPIADLCEYPLRVFPSVMAPTGKTRDV
jgi:endonuclease III